MQGEEFAKPADIVKAHQIVERELGPTFDINFLGLPKNVGNKGDGRHYGHSVVISCTDIELIRPLVDEASARAQYRKECLERKEPPEGPDEALQKVSAAICNSTPATRVLLDITPDNSLFIVDS